MILELSIMGTVDPKYKTEHSVIEQISKMFTVINKLDFKKHQDLQERLK